MKIDEHRGRKYVKIGPGEYHVSNQNVVLTTLLGSCVSACLYDPVARVVGMNHFLLSNRRYAKEMPLCVTEAGRYGVHAMELLINDMLKLGAKRSNIKAKAFGGGAVLQSVNNRDNFFCVGEVNSRFILEFLKNDKIPLVSSDLGGNTGRVIQFLSNDFSVMVRKIHQRASLKVVKEEKNFWKHSIKAQEKKKTDSDLWV